MTDPEVVRAHLLAEAGIGDVEQYRDVLLRLADLGVYSRAFAERTAREGPPVVLPRALSPPVRYHSSVELDGAEAAAVRAFRGRFEAETGVTIRRLAVFGSRARGTWDQESDVDLLVLVDSATWDLRRRAAGIAADAGAPAGVLLSPKVFSVAEWPHRAAEALSFAAAVEAEAVDL